VALGTTGANDATLSEAVEGNRIICTPEASCSQHGTPTGKMRGAVERKVLEADAYLASP